MNKVIVKLKNGEDFIVQDIDFQALLDYLSEVPCNSDKLLCFYNLVVSLSDILYIHKEEEEEE